jgi:uncharacterized protein YbaP (TraB family)
MRSKALVLLTFLFSLFISQAGAESAAPSATQPATKSAAPSADTDRPRGTLYRVRHQGNTSYLFGTIHVGRPNFYPLEPRVTKAFAESGRLVVEFDIRNAAQVMTAVTKYGMYGADDTIEKHLSAKTLAQLRQAMARTGLPFEPMARMKPWMLANLLLLVDMEKNGLSAAQGTDLFLLAQADAQSKPVEELETADYQLSLFDAMPAAQQEQYLRENLDELASGKSLRKSMEMMHAWSRANGSAFEDLLREALAEKTLSSEFMVRTLLNKRNAEMAAKVEALLKREKPSFVAVGLLHLVGQKGVPELLKAKGYEVEKVY